MVPTDKEERGEDEEGDPHSPGGREFEHGVGKCGEVRSCAGGVHAEIKGRGDQGGMDEEGGARAEGARGGLVFGRRGARMGGWTTSVWVEWCGFDQGGWVQSRRGPGGWGWQSMSVSNDQA